MGPVQRADTRSEVVDRLIAMLRQAHEAGATLVVFPELALTTFFPRWVIDDAEELDGYFESEMPNNETQPLFEAAREGWRSASTSATPRCRPRTTARSATSTRRSWWTARAGSPASTARSTYPATPSRNPARCTSTWRSATSSPADLGFPVFRSMDGVMGMCICNDRRWPETYRVMGLQGRRGWSCSATTRPAPIPSPGGRRRRTSACSTTTSRCRPAPTRTAPGWWPRPRPAWRKASTTWAEAASSRPPASSWPWPRARATRS